MPLRTTLLTLTSALAFLSLTSGQAASLDPTKLPPASDKKDLTYARDIKPIFDHACLKCHSANKPKGDLRLDSLAGILKGSEDGKVVMPGDSAQSRLIYAVARSQVKAMPPKDKAPPLSAEQVGLIRAWIDQGAK
jgi:hypothetical protein